jgi:hypothetical protein
MEALYHLDLDGARLVLLNEICRSLRYKGLALILDEAEHVRGYSVNRRERANNLFDLLVRAAHRPIPRDTPAGAKRSCAGDP